MFKQLFIGGSVCVALGLSALPVVAQTSPAPQPSPAPQSQPAPATSNVSQTEVEHFADTVRDILTIVQDAQKQQESMFSGESMSRERFAAIYQAQQNNPPTQPSPEVTAQERESFDRLFSQLQALRETTRGRIDQAIQAGELPQERFAQIDNMLRQDAGLRQRVEQRVEQILQNQGTPN